MTAAALPHLPVAAGVIELDLTGMTCASCAGRIEKALARVPGVESASVNLATGTATLQAPASATAAAIAAVEGAGYGAALKGDRPAAVPEHGRGIAKVLLAAALTVPLVLPMAISLAGIHWMLPAWL